ncbi:MAG: hypothetical protein ACXVJO_07420, partial [Thermoanaerobaculia bacterium]
MARLLSALIVAQLTTTAVFAVLPSGVESLAPFQASSLTTAPDGAVYAANGPVDGDSSCCWIVRIDGGTTVPIYRDDSSMFGLTATPDGALAFWTVGDGLKRLSNGSVKSISAPDFLALGGIAAASDGAIWYSGAFGGGLVRVGLAGDTAQYFASEFLISIVPGRNGSIWAPSRYEQKIVHVQNDGRFTTIVHNAACCGGVVTAADGNGGLWFTTPGDSTIYHLDASDRPLQSLSTPGFNYYWSLFVARDGSL